MNTYLSKSLASKRPSSLLMAKNVSFGRGLVKMSASWFLVSTNMFLSTPYAKFKNKDSWYDIWTLISFNICLVWLNMMFMVFDIWLSGFHFNLVLFKLCFVYVLNYSCFTYFGLFYVAKGGEKNGYFRNQDIIFSKL